MRIGVQCTATRTSESRTVGFRKVSVRTLIGKLPSSSSRKQRFTSSTVLQLPVLATLPGTSTTPYPYLT